MTLAATVPPASVRWRFWLLGTRVEPLWRPWVAEQLTAPRYVQRRLLTGLLLPLLFVVLPQLALALTDGRWSRLWIAGLYALGLLLGLTLGLRKRDEQVARLLAYHGVTRDGRLVEPAPAWPASGFTKASAAVLVGVLLVLSVGVTFAVSQHASPSRCQDAPLSGVAAVEELLGVAQLPGGPPKEPLFRDGRIVDARRVDAGLDGLYYLAAHVDGVPAGLPSGPALWRVIEPGGVFEFPERDVNPVGDVAHALSPGVSYITGPLDAPMEKALDCARDAHG